MNTLYRLDVDVISTELPTMGKCEKAMQLTLEREMDLMQVRVNHKMCSSHMQRIVELEQPLM